MPNICNNLRSGWVRPGPSPGGNYCEIKGRECLIAIQPRPAYCDRGNFVATLDAYGELALDLDYADCWPRFYFDFQVAMMEVEAWLVKRKQWIDPV